MKPVTDYEFRGSPIPQELRSLSSEYLIQPIKRKRLLNAIRSLFPSRQASSSPMESQQTSPVIGSTTSQMTSILLAEDNPINIKVAINVLKRLGYNSVDVAKDGQEAVDMARQRKYEVILMDVLMPRMDGLEASKAIRNTPTTRPHRPYIIAMTANALSGDRERCMEAGMDDYGQFHRLNALVTLN
jgi:CheY-like chemotaxis protein